ncbi:hypothetical protein [Litoribaculum gwangyangense]|uniref:Uncharacterized protein n=1 Tax=Litoribaculum gwangyangense TaxID=1130722 RepID=A0ABP9CJI0_9FLAO
MTTISGLDFIVKIDELQKSEFVAKSYSGELLSNQVLLEIEKNSCL